MRFRLGKTFVFYGDENDNGGDPPATPPAPPKTFTQEEVDKIIANRLKKEKAQSTKLLDDLESFKAKANLSEEEKTTLQTQIDELQARLMTKEELAEQERQKFEKNHKQVTEGLAAERDKYKTLYTNSTITRAIVDAASQNDAAVPSQLVAMLSPNTRLVEVKGEDGKPTGEYEPYVKVSGLDKDGKPVALDLPVFDAVKQMKEWPSLYGNLFKDTKTGGVGATNTGSGSNVNPNNVKSFEDWEKVRKLQGLR